jgi:hypothetical protein
MSDRRNELLKPNQKFHIKQPDGKMFHVHTNEGLEAMLESGYVHQDAVITIAVSNNNSDPFNTKTVKKIPYLDGYRYEIK